mgnify:CR=1 FL=1
MQGLLTKALFIAGSLLCLHASWLPTKAWLSQQLISHSWQQSKSQASPVKPWPWADTYPIAELSFNRLKQDLVVLNGGDPTTLAFSPGAIAPFNQVTGNQAFVVAGHRDSHFSLLKDVVMNDIISLTDKQGRNQLYQVESIEIVDASTGQLPLTSDDPSLVLITCYPFNSAVSDKNERYVIRARQL